MQLGVSLIVYCFKTWSTITVSYITIKGENPMKWHRKKTISTLSLT